MKVIAVLGSPHEDGPSSTIARRVLDGARDAGHEVKVYEINKMDVRGCQGCRHCKENNVDCILDDALKPYWKELHSAGALVVSAPNYASNICGPMITYMNRHYCLLDKDWKVRVHPGIKLIGVFSQGRPEHNAFFDANYKWYLADFQNRKMELVDMIVHMGRESTAQDSPVMKRAYEAGKGLS